MGGGSVNDAEEVETAVGGWPSARDVVADLIQLI